MTRSKFEMMRYLLSIACFIIPGLALAQCTVDLGDDIQNCTGGPVSVTAIYSGDSAPDSLYITYDATQGVSGLAGANSVYIHSGIQTVPFGGWEYTIGNWGVDDGLGQMTAVGNNMWAITLVVPEYYGYPGGTNVIGLWMVFRNADGSATGKNDLDEDIFLETSNNNFSPFGGVIGTDLPGNTGGLMWSTGSTAETISVTQTGNYSVTYTDGLGCTSTDSIQVDISIGSASVDLGPDTMLCDGASVTLDAGSGFSGYAWSTGETTQMITVDTAGDYSVTVTDAGGCTGIDLINVGVGGTPAGDFDYAATSGLTVEFTDISTDATSILWDLNGDGTVDETAAPGASVQYTFPSASVYGVVMIAVGACGNDTVSQNVLVTDVGISELAEEIGLTVAPNPSSDLIRISTDGNQKISIIRLTDTSGREVFSGTQTTIDLSNLDNGFYVLSVGTEKGIATRTIIKN